MKKRKLFLGHLIIIFALVIFSCSDLTSSINAPVKEYFQKYSDTALITELIPNRAADGSFGGVNYFSSKDDLHFKLPVVNPRNYDLKFECTFDDDTINNSQYSLEQDVNDKSLVHFNFNKDFLLAKDKLEKTSSNTVISGVIQIFEKNSNREFLDFKFKFGINSRPPKVQNLMIQSSENKDSVSEDGKYILCFFMPNIPSIDNGVHKNDTKQIVINNKTYYFKNDESFKFYEDAACEKESSLFSTSFTVYPVGNESAFSSYSTIQNYTKVYFDINISRLSTQLLDYTVYLKDNLGFTSEKVNCSNKGKRIADATLKLGTTPLVNSTVSTLDDAGENDNGIRTLSITASSVDTEGNSITGTKINYKLTEKNSRNVFTVDNSPVNEISGTVEYQISFDIPQGNYTLTYSLEKEGYTSQSEKAINFVLMPGQNVYVKNDGDDISGNGTHQNPYKSINKAIKQIAINRNDFYSTDTLADKELKVTLLSDIKEPDSSSTYTIECDVKDTGKLCFTSSGTNSYTVTPSTNKDFIKITNTQNVAKPVTFKKIKFENLCNASVSNTASNTNTIYTKTTLNFENCTFTDCKYGSAFIKNEGGTNRSISLKNVNFVEVKPKDDTTESTLVRSSGSITLEKDETGTKLDTNCGGSKTTLFYASKDINIYNIMINSGVGALNAFKSEQSINYDVVNSSSRIYCNSITNLFYLIGNGQIKLQKSFLGTSYYNDYKIENVKNFAKMSKGTKTSYGTINMSSSTAWAEKDKLYTILYEGVPTNATCITGFNNTNSSPTKDDMIAFKDQIKVKDTNDKYYYIDDSAKVQSKSNSSGNPSLVELAENDSLYNSKNEFYIYDREDLKKLKYMIDDKNKDFKDKTVKLMDNITALDTSIGYINNYDFKPDNTYNRLFSGTFDGDNKTITLIDKITWGNQNYGGLFNFVSGATIKNVKIAGNSNVAGGIAFYAYNTTITDCENSANITQNSWHTGGIVGIAIDSTIKNCKNSGTITGNENSNLGSNVGGIVGRLSTWCEIDGVGNNASIESCTNYGTVQKGENVGGIVGKVDKYDSKGVYENGSWHYITGTNKPTVKKCTHTNSASVSGGKTSAGGIAGSAPSGSVSTSGTETCTVTGSYSGESGAKVGQIVGDRYIWSKDELVVIAR